MSKKTGFSMTQKEAQLIVDAIVVRENGEWCGCALCKYVDNKKGIGGPCLPTCPVARYTGKNACVDTPYGIGTDEEIIAFGMKILDADGYEIAEEDA